MASRTGHWGARNSASVMLCAISTTNQESTRKWRSSGFAFFCLRNSTGEGHESNLPKFCVSLDDGFSVIHERDYDSEVIGCVHARSLRARILLAAAGSGWVVLPGLFAVRG